MPLYGSIVPSISTSTCLPSVLSTNKTDCAHKEIKGRESYIHYENYDAIEVPHTDAIPSDYNGIMGVPITFLDKYCPEQFEILGLDDHREEWRGKGPDINGKTIYRRIIIKRK